MISVVGDVRSTEWLRRYYTAVNEFGVYLRIKDLRWFSVRKSLERTTITMKS